MCPSETAHALKHRLKYNGWWDHCSKLDIDFSITMAMILYTHNVLGAVVNDSNNKATSCYNLLF